MLCQPMMARPSAAVLHPPCWPAFLLTPPAGTVALLQEAQQETTASFERYIDDCSEKDWAQDKRRLFSIIAPHTGLDTAAASGMGPAGRQPTWLCACRG
jgi:hypothetical protein